MNEAKIMGVKAYLTSIGYEPTQEFYEVNRDIKEICTLTKTRAGEPKDGYRWEQTYLMRAIAQRHRAKRIFEIGTGRGTTAIAMAKTPGVELVTTIDTIHPDRQRLESVNWKQEMVSNSDLAKQIPGRELWVDKLVMLQCNSMDLNPDDYPDQDIVFIDGNHSDRGIVQLDYENARQMVRPGGLIIFDDYGRECAPAVTWVVDNIDESTIEDLALVEIHGKLFPVNIARKADQGMGVVIIKIPA